MSAKGSPGNPALGRLVEKQMRNWELAKAQRLAVPEPRRGELEDFIAISRQVAAGGREVAAKVGEALRWPVFDKEILNTMAGDDALRRQIYDSLDERDLSWCEKTLRALFEPGQFGRDDYFPRLTRTVLSLARQGHAVFLGRGTHLILPQDRGLRVRLVAPVDLRVQRFAEEHQLPPEEARRELERIEHDRAEFLRNHFHAETEEATQHDMIINIRRLSTDQAADLVLAAWKKVHKEDAL